MYTTHYGYYDPTMAAAVTFLSGYAVLLLALAVLAIIAGWRIFEKAGRPGWATLVPFYRDYITCQIFWGEGWLFLVPVVLFLLAFVPVIGFIFAIGSAVFNILTVYKKAEAFGERIGFTIGLLLLPFIFNMILAFSRRYEYLGVPIDGVNYKDVKAKYDNFNDRPVNYEAPPAEEHHDISYEQPVQSEKSGINNETSDNAVKPEAVTPEVIDSDDAEPKDD